MRARGVRGVKELKNAPKRRVLLRAPPALREQPCPKEGHGGAPPLAAVLLERAYRPAAEPVHARTRRSPAKTAVCTPKTAARRATFHTAVLARGVVLPMGPNQACNGDSVHSVAFASLFIAGLAHAMDPTIARACTGVMKAVTVKYEFHRRACSEGKKAAGDAGVGTGGTLGHGTMKPSLPLSWDRRSTSARYAVTLSRTMTGTPQRDTFRRRVWLSTRLTLETQHEKLVDIGIWYDDHLLSKGSFSSS